jgi:hypothetical protein
MKGNKQTPETPSAPTSTFAKVLKWAGAITALLSLVFALQRVIQMASDTRERKRSTAELYKVGKLQQSSADYGAAWATFEKGLQTAQPGGQLARLTGQLDKEQRLFREAQEDLAMEWLQNLRLKGSSGQSFADAVDPLAAILTRGITNASGERKADLLAHFGWANFLRWRDGDRELEPEAQYRQALEVDPANPFAHAYLAHWLLWTRRGSALPEARTHFAAALRAGRAHDEVRGKQIAALQNLNDTGEADLLRVAAEMRGNREPMDAGALSRVRNIYQDLCGRYWRNYDYEKRGEVIRGAVSPAEHLANVQVLFVGSDDLTESVALSRDACRATLLEAFGRGPDALHVWQNVRPAAHRDGTWSAYGVAAIKRLSAPATR